MNSDIFRLLNEAAARDAELAALRADNAKMGRMLLEAEEAVMLSGGELIKLRTKLEESQRENDTLRGLLGNSSKDCLYCGLPAAEQAKCAHGFPGCSRADDQMLSQHFAAGYAVECLQKELEEAERKLADARREGIEEAARICNKIAYDEEGICVRIDAEECEDAIRAAADQPEKEQL